MTHFWIRAEARPNEARFPVTPEGVRALVAKGHAVTLEKSPTRAIPDEDFEGTGSTLAPTATWENAPQDAIILGLKELPEGTTPLPHRHILFGHAYKGQPAGQILLKRFKDGGGTLLDLEYLTDPLGRRVAAFGYWAGYAGAAVSLSVWAAQQANHPTPEVKAVGSATELLADLQARLTRAGAYSRPSAIIIGAKGRVGSGARDFCTAMGVAVTEWDMEETAHGGPFHEILTHDIFLNCILARPGTPVFVPGNAPYLARRLSVIGDIACDPDSDFSPIKVYDRSTTWAEPALRVHATPPLDVMAIDNLPSMMPVEASEDFAEQLLPHLLQFDTDPDAVWTRAQDTFRAHT